jgi:condensin complex subunit 2
MVLANINISKLDAAYDIDPLFHKMSKAFDEVGAKGLLLVNLGVGNQGCNIVFDSAQQQDGHDDAPADDAADLEADEAAVDITSLSTKLADLLGDTTLESLQLVPQLQTLRQEYAVLEQEGFIAHENIKRVS